MWTEVEQRALEAAARRDGEVSVAVRREHGVVHTPPELCRYVAKACENALHARLGHGLGHSSVTLVDPACGPGGFLAAALAVTEGVPGRFVGMDRDAPALKVASEVLGGEVHRRGGSLELRAGDALESLDVFDDAGVLVVLGNPPWASKTASKTELSEELLEDFRRDADGKRLGERKIGVLSDSYVRFWRWAAEGVRRAPAGIVALVTNASFLDGPVHRGMRAAMTRWFDSIDVVDLGGSALVAQSKDRDENVFGVRPSVAVSIATKTQKPPAKVRVCAIRGTRAQKLEALSRELSFRTVDPTRTWREIPDEARASYPEGWVALDQVFPFHREGVQTNRDAVVIDADEERLQARLQSFVLGLRRPDLDAAWIPKKHYDPERARRAVQHAMPDCVRSIAYRPWDNRSYAAVSPLCHRPRPRLALAMSKSTMALLSVRKDRGERGWRHFGVSRTIPDNCFLSARSSCRTRAFPTHDPEGNPNLGTRASARCDDPETWVAYTLAILAAQSYQEAFSWLLAQDYPQLPIAKNLEEIAEAGHVLAALFLDGEPSEEVGRVGHWERTVPAGFADALARCESLVAPLLSD